MKKALFLFGALCLAFVFASKAYAADLSAGDLIKAGQPSVYYYGADGKRYVFPNEKTYKTWYSDFSTVKTVTDAELAAISIGGNVTYKPGIKMVKINTDPKVYAISKGGNLRWITTEALAVSLYGADWNTKIEDVPDAFFTNYLVGSPIENTDDYSVADELTAAVSITVDKNLSSPPAVPCSGCGSTPSVTYQWNAKTVNGDGYYHKGLKFGDFNEGFAATWYDDRNGQNEVFYEKTDAAGMGSGVINKVSDNITDSNSGALAHDGDNFYILWEDSSPLHRAIYSEKYDLSENKIKKLLFASSTYATSRYPDIAWNETLGEYGVAWWDTESTQSGGSGDLYFSIMFIDGTKFGPKLNVTPAPSSDFKPKIISAGDKFAVIWQGDDKIVKMALINNDSAIVGSVKSIASANQVSEPRLAWTGSGFGAVWVEKTGDYQDVYYAQLDNLGNLVGSKVALTSGTGDATEPDILWDGSKFYVAYTNYKPNTTTAASDVRVIKIDTSGNITGEETRVSGLGATAFSPRLAKNGTAIAVAWIENSAVADKIMSAVETVK